MRERRSHTSGAGKCLSVGHAALDAPKPGNSHQVRDHVNIVVLAKPERPRSRSRSVPGCRRAGVSGCRGIAVPGNRGAGVSRCRDVDAAGDTSWLDPVSCISPARCVAVGYRHDPAVRYSFRTLALGWNGKTWTFEKTINE
jgi:hypothetical protein